MKREHPAHPPSAYAVLRVDYGSENKHLYTIDEWGGVEFCKDEANARRIAKERVEEDPRAIIALLKVDELLAAKIEVWGVSTAK